MSFFINFGIWILYQVWGENLEFRNSQCNYLISATQVFTACPGNSPGQTEPAQLELGGSLNSGWPLQNWAKRLSCSRWSPQATPTPAYSKPGHFAREERIPNGSRCFLFRCIILLQNIEVLFQTQVSKDEKNC